MRKILLLSFVMLAFLGLANAQESSGKAFLDKLAKQYENYKTIQAEFSFQAQQQNGQPYTDQGELFLNRSANQYKILLSAQDIISDGKAIWSVLKEDQEVQISPADDNAYEIGPSNIFSFYQKGYSSGIVKKDHDPQAGELKSVELQPEEGSSNYQKIRIRVNKNMHIHDVTIWDKSGSTYSYSIHALYVNHKLPASTFRYQKADYPGFELVDLR